MLQDVFDNLMKILPFIATLSKDRRELRDTALKAIANALDETFLYYRDLSNGSDRNREREAILVKYWSAAAIPIRHFDGELAVMCDLKSEYWVNPDHYTMEDIQTFKIGLNEIRGAYRKLLMPSFSKSMRK